MLLFDCAALFVDQDAIIFSCLFFSFSFFSKKPDIAAF